MRASVKALALAAFVLLSGSACSDCNCNGAKKSTTGEAKKDAPTEATPQVDPKELVDARIQAIVRVESIKLVDEQTDLFLEPEEEGDPEVSFSFRDDVLRGWIGGKALEKLRLDGNAELIWLAPPARSGDEEAKAPPRGDWIAVLPVEDVKVFLADIGALDAGDGLMSWQEAGVTVWANSAPVELLRGQTSDVKPRVALSSTPEGARHAEALLREHVREQRRHLQILFWPTRQGLTERWSDFAQDMRQRISAAGHGLAPPRTSLLNLETNLYHQLGSPENWPEPLHFVADYKIRGGKPKAIRTYLFAPLLDEDGPYGVLHEAMLPRKGGIPPKTADRAPAMLRLRLDRSELDEVLDAVFPEHLRLLLAARGEDSMLTLRNVASDLLDHNRGAMTLAFYPQRVPLSGETFVAWEASDREQLPGESARFHKALVENFWAPLHLADVSTLEEGAFTGQGGALKGGVTTFEIAAGDKRLKLGACWAIKGEHYYAYYGYKPCEKLEAKVPTELVEQQPPSVALDVDLGAALNLLYVPPGRQLEGEFGSVEDPVRLEINGYARQETDQPKQFEFEAQIKSREVLRSLLLHKDELIKHWRYRSDVDMSELFQRAHMEQSLYQEPGLLMIGPPGLMGAAPPSYFLGLPFALPPAPPDQLRRAVLSEPTEE